MGVSPELSSAGLGGMVDFDVSHRACQKCVAHGKPLVNGQPRVAAHTEPGGVCEPKGCSSQCGSTSLPRAGSGLACMVCSRVCHLADDLARKVVWWMMVSLFSCNAQQQKTHQIPAGSLGSAKSYPVLWRSAHISRSTQRSPNPRIKQSRKQRV